MGDLRSNRPFMSLLSGRVITNMGDSLYFIAAMWLVYDLSGSTLYTGLAGFLIRGPAAMQFLLGPLIDNMSLRKLLVGTQLIQSVVLLFVPIVAFTGNLSVWVVLAVLPIISFFNKFVYPAQSAALPQLVDDEQLVRANSLFAIARNSLDMVFNAISGVIIAAIGAVSIFVINSVTFLVAAMLFWGVAVERPNNETEGDGKVEQYKNSLVEGGRYIRGSLIMVIVYASLVTNFVFGAGIAVFPAFADQIGGAAVYGFLMAAMGAGVLVGSILSNYVDKYPYGWFQIYTKPIAGLLLAAGVYLLWLPGTVFLIFSAFIFFGMSGPMTQALIQSGIDESLLGRVSSLIGSLGTVMIPLGSLLGGFFAQYIGINTVLYGVAAATIVFGLYFFVHPQLRKIPPVDEVNESVLGIERDVASS